MKPKHREDLDFMTDVEAAIHDRGSRMAYVLSITVCLLVLAFAFWSRHAVLDEVTRAAGTVIPSQRVQVIQNLEGGILKALLVRENQEVAKGDVLVRLDNAVAESIYREARNKIREHEAAILRLTAESRGDRPVFPESLEREAPEICRDQRSIFDARSEELSQELKVLETVREQRGLDVREMTTRMREMKANLVLAQEQLALVTPMAEKGVYPRVDFLKLKREVLKTQSDLETLKISIPKGRKAASEARFRVAQKEAEARREALAEIGKRRVALQSLRESFTAGEDRVTRTDVRSPVKGTVKQILINTIGGVVRPGDPILEIVPYDDTLLIEAKVRPSSIAFLHPGQKAKIKISAYDFSIYGGLEGVVEQISVDSIQDGRGETFFKVKLRTRTNAISYRGNRLPIISGMTADVDILTGKKTVFDYLMKPILKARQNAMRER